MGRFLGIAIIFLLLHSVAWAETYYIDATGGDDTNNGTSSVTAWKTISGSLTISGGDTVLFKRGEMWRNQKITPLTGSGSAYTIYGAYGEGNKPRLMMSTNESETTDWTDEGSNIWSNNDTTFDVDVGNIVFNYGDSVGIKQFTESDVNTDLEFWYDEDNDLVKLYSTSNPASRFQDIECCRYEYIIHAEDVDCFVIQDMHVTHGAAHGIYLEDGCDYVTIKDCDVTWIGGADQYGGDSVVRYGNGIEVWNSGSNITIERCYFTQTYDEATTTQGGGIKSNHYVRNNVYYKCHWAWHPQLNDLVDISEIYFENNTCVDAGSWSSVDEQRPSNYPDFVNIDVQIGTADSIYVRNNIFSETVTGNERCVVITSDFLDNSTNFVIDNNCYDQDTDVMIHYGANDYTQAEFAAYQAAKSQDANSIATDPLFSGTNWKLSSSSPCIDVGLTLSDVIDDYDGVNRPVGAGHDMGAFEYANTVINNATIKDSSL